MTSQKEAVFAAVCAVATVGEGKVELSSEQKQKVYAQLTHGFMEGQIAYSKDSIPEGKDLRNYITGLVNNWLRKDTRLNGGEKYQAKNPGVRSGSGDESVKAMKQLLTVITDPAHREEIQVALAARQAELKPKVSINTSALPESLRHLVS